MNHWKLLGGLSLALLSATAWASQPIGNLDALEARYVACLEIKLANNCLDNICLPGGTCSVTLLNR